MKEQPQEIGLPPPELGRSWWGPAAVVALGLLAYANAYGGALVFDDLQQIRENPLVRDLGAMASADGYWSLPSRWVAYLTFALNHRLTGAAPAPFHAVNVAIHLCNALLVYALVRTTFRTPRLRGSSLAPQAGAVAFVAAALFVAHPIQTQAVTYVVQRITSLAALFYLAAVLLYVRWRLAPADARVANRVLSYAGVVLLAVLSSHTKEIAVTLPFAIVLYELCFLAPRPRRWLATAPLFTVAALVPLLRVLAPAGAGGGDPAATVGTAIAGATRAQTALPRLDYLLTQGPIVVRYLGLLFVPVGQNLDPDVPIHRSPLEPPVVGAAIVLAGLCLLAVLLAVRARAGAARRLDPSALVAAFGIGWWFLTLSVESSFIPILDLMNEHRVYLPSAGAFTAVAVGLAAVARRWPGPQRASRALVAAGALLGVLLAGATLARNTVWRDEVTLWSDAARKAPGKLRPAVNLGTALADAGRHVEAVVLFRRAVVLDPSSAYARAQLAAALANTGRPAEAERELREVVRLAPGDVESTFNLAMLLWRSGRRDEARRWFARFLEIAPAGGGFADARRLAERVTRP